MATVFKEHSLQGAQSSGTPDKGQGEGCRQWRQRADVPVPGTGSSNRQCRVAARRRSGILRPRRILWKAGCLREQLTFHGHHSLGYHGDLRIFHGCRLDGAGHRGAWRSFRDFARAPRRPYASGQRTSARPRKMPNPALKVHGAAWTSGSPCLRPWCGVPRLPVCGCHRWSLPSSAACWPSSAACSCCVPPRKVSGDERTFPPSGAKPPQPMPRGGGA